MSYRICETLETEKQAMRDVYCQTMIDLANQNDRIVVMDADLMNSVGTVPFGEAHPERTVNCGIQEANMIGVAAGMSAVGMVPYCHTFGCFATRRCLDQIFVSAAFAKANIRIIGSDPGITAAMNGATHMPFEDMALYRTIPGSVVVDATDVPMLTAFLEMAKDLPGVKYVRVGRKGSCQVYEDGAKFEIGKGQVLREGGDAVIIACGIMVHEAMQAAAQLAREGIEAAVIDPFTVKPLDDSLIRTYAARTGVVVTAENHNKIGGLYSAVKECLDGEARVGYVAVEDAFGEVGPQDYLRTRFDLTWEHIARQVRETRKKAGR